MLKRVESFLRTITQCMPAAARQPRKPKTGMEHIYQFTLDGRLELFKVPKVGVQAVFLALYCYDPDSASVDQLVESTGLVKSSLAAFLAQKPYNGYVQKVGESLFRLNHKGKVWVVYEILPSLGIEAPVLQNEVTDED